MTYENLGLLYNRHYFSRFINDTSSANDQIYNYAIDTGDKPILGSNLQHLFFKTTYPGLISGIGYPHEAEKMNKEALLTGFYFDFSSGAPCIPGSSVKGVVRSMVKNSEFTIQYLCTDIMAKILSSYESDQYETFIEALFGRDPSKHKSYETDTRSIYDRIIFLDSYAVDNLGNTVKNKVFSEDFLAPHKDGGVHSLLSNPDLVRFLKVVPQVVFDFPFMVPQKLICGEDIFYQKDLLFLIREAILNVGVGAKTNVGYGQLESLPEYNRTARSRPNSVLEETRKLIGEQREGNQSYAMNIADFGQYKGGKTIEMTILAIEDGIVYLKNGKDILPPKTLQSIERKFKRDNEKDKNKSKSYKPITTGSKVKVRINRTFTTLVQNFTILPTWK